MAGCALATLDGGSGGKLRAWDSAWGIGMGLCRLDVLGGKGGGGGATQLVWEAEDGAPDPEGALPLTPLRPCWWPLDVTEADSG